MFSLTMKITSIKSAFTRYSGESYFVFLVFSLTLSKRNRLHKLVIVLATTVQAHAHKKHTRTKVKSLTLIPNS